MPYRRETLAQSFVSDKVGFGPFHHKLPCNQSGHCVIFKEWISELVKMSGGRD